MKTILFFLLSFIVVSCSSSPDEKIKFLNQSIRYHDSLSNYVYKNDLNSNELDKVKNLKSNFKLIKVPAGFSEGRKVSDMLNDSYEITIEYFSKNNITESEFNEKLKLRESYQLIMDAQLKVHD
ncbi:MAG TPA: hypothetical protein DEP28_10155, partial [Bacteroidetes bacterium]|nr:hypothetical protein [Bacteroidota bacterium]HCN37068.1 hypothetical protein [Bacteroidota bacterium]HRE42214.1 hypothetical protein [Ignavibacteria bacterium]